MTDPNHIEVLREIRRVYIDPETIAALDAAITALSARASAGEGGELTVDVSKVSAAEATALGNADFANFLRYLAGGELHESSYQVTFAEAARRIATAAPQPAQAGASGGEWAPTCQKCRMTITRPGECAIGGQHCQCPTTPASPATGDAATWEEEIRRHDATPQPAAAQGGEWVMVPRKVTHAMLVAYWSYGSDEPLDESLLTDGDLGVFQGEWNDILAAAPQPQEAPWSITAEWVIGYLPAYVQKDGYGKFNDAVQLCREEVAHAFAEWNALTTRPTPEAQEARDADTKRLDWIAREALFIVVNAKHFGMKDVQVIKPTRAAIDAALALPAQGEGKNG